MKSLLILISSISTIISCSSVTYYSSTTQSGKATYYGGNEGNGACGFEDVEKSSFPFGYYAAIGGDNFDSGYGCGRCFEITCIGPYSDNPSCHCDSETPTVIIQGLDQCPECEASHFDLDPTAMARIVGDGLSGTCGVIAIEYRRVSCDITSNIKIRAKSGTSKHWYGLHLDDVAGYGSVSKAEIKSSGSSTWNALNKDTPSFWLLSSGYPLTAPLTLRLTNEMDEVIVCDNVITDFAGGATFDCGTNFATDATRSPTAPTIEITPSPTNEDTSGASCDDETSLTVTNHDDSQIYWMALYITNVCTSCGGIISVEIKDSVNYQSWYSSTDIDGDYYGFDNQGGDVAAFTEPISVRITNENDEIIIVSNVITDFDIPTVTDSGDNFCRSLSSSTTKEPLSTTTNDIDVSTTEEPFGGSDATWCTGFVGLITVIIHCVYN